VSETARTQEQFPHLTVISDHEQSLARAADVIAPQHSPTGGDTVAPTTVLIDRDGQVRWVYRPENYLTRLPPEELLAAIDRHVPRSP
jgi:peroxiredoxin